MKAVDGVRGVVSGVEGLVNTKREGQVGRVRARIRECFFMEQKCSISLMANKESIIL